MQLQNIQITGGLTFIPEILSPSGDPYWANVSLLMNTTSTNNQTNNTFLDSSTNNFAVTRVGAPTQGSFTPFALAPNTSYSTATNGGSAYFDGSGDFLTIANNSALNILSGDFTIETWFYPNTVSNIRTLIGQWQQTAGLAGYVLRQNGATVQFAFGAIDINNPILSSSTAVVINTWNHVAVTRSASTFTLWLNGVSVATTSSAATLGAINVPTSLGQYYNSSGTLGATGVSDLFGYLSSTRIVKGTAVYTSAFTPPTSPLTAIANTSLLLNFTNGGIFDSATKNNLTTIGDAKVSTTQSKFAPTSVVFDGTGDYLTIPSSTGLDIATGDFTVEFWFNTNSVVLASQGLVVRFNGNAVDRNSLQYGFFLNQNSLTIAPYSSTNNYDMTFSNSITAGTWYHVALVRTGNTFYAYLNGQQNATTRTITGALNNNAAWVTYIGRYTEGGSNKDYNGFIQDVRITKGVARYTANFTPPTTAFPTF